MISFYINYLEDDELVTATFEDFAGFLPFWNTQLGKINTSSVVIHCGRENIITEIPSDNNISDIVSKPVFFTESVKWCVPKLYSGTFVNPICELVSGVQKEKVRLYLSLYEWDYCISEKEIELLYEKFPEQTTISGGTLTTGEAYGWIQSLLESPSVSKSEKEKLLSLRIVTPESYNKNYTKIPNGLNFKCEYIRYLVHKNKIRDYDFHTLLDYMPHFLDDTEIHTMRLGVRPTNGLIRAGYSKLGDLRGFNPDGLARQRNVGKKSMKVIWDKISSFIEQSCSEDCTNLIDNTDIKARYTFYENIENSLIKYISESNKSDERRKFILDAVRSRLGLNKDGDIQTLQEIANKYSVTRERVRQIVQAAINEIICYEDWDDLMINKINELIKENEKSTHPEPIFLDMLEVKDKWFEGFGGNMSALRSCIEEFSAQPKFNKNDLNQRTLSKFGRSKKEINFTIIEPEQIARYIIFKPTPLIKSSYGFDIFIKSLIEKIEALVESNSWSRYDSNFNTVLQEESKIIIEEECALHGLEILSITILEIVIKHFSGNSTKQELVNQYIHELFQNNNSLLSLDKLIMHITQKGITGSSRYKDQLIKRSIRSFGGLIYYLSQGAYGNRECYENKYEHLGKSEINYYLNLIDEITSEREFNEFACGNLLHEIKKRTPPSYFKNYWIDVYFLKFNLNNDAKYEHDEVIGLTFNFKRV
jgi:hypothetical protein